MLVPKVSLRVSLRRGGIVKKWRCRHSAQHDHDSAEREQQSQNKKHVKIKDSLDGGDQSKMWSEETRTLKHIRDIGGESGLPTMCGIGAWAVLLKYFRKEPSQQSEVARKGTLCHLCLIIIWHKNSRFLPIALCKQTSIKYKWRSFQRGLLQDWGARSSELCGWKQKFSTGCHSHSIALCVPEET